MKVFSVIFIAVFIKTNFLNVLSADENCTAFVNNYQDHISITSFPSVPQPGNNLKICTTGERSCCTPEIEEKLKNISKSDYDKTVKKTLQSLSRMLKSKSVKFNEYFKELLNKSKKDLHEMYKETYGMVYEQHSYVFSDFFLELERYYSNGKSNLADVMEMFFNILYQKMFIVLNSQYKFDEKYLGCISEHMNELEPFGDIPQRFSSPLKRSFVAARTYSQSLSIVGDIVANLMNLMPTDSCLDGITKMLHCSSCKGLNGAKVCDNFCLNVMKGCLALYTELDVEWSAFVEAMSRVESRLSKSYNIGQVVDPINVKISEAIMNFQENAHVVSSKVFNGCGKPPLKVNRRRRRQVGGGFSETTDFEEKNNRRSNNRPDRKKKEKENSGHKNEKNRKKNKDEYEEEDKSNPAYGFLKFIKEIGNQVVNTRYFWKRLPYHVCSDELQVESNRTVNCWNGKTMGIYDTALMNDGLKNQQSNPEVIVDPKYNPNLLTDQILALKTVSNQLKNAFNGYDVEWIDNEEAFDPGSGSGAGPDLEGPIDSVFEGSGDTPPRFDIKPESTSVISDVTIRVLENNTDLSTSFVTPDVRRLTEPSTIYETSTVSISTVSSTTINNMNNTSSGTSITYQKITLSKAIASYLLPTVVVWMGKSFNNWVYSLV